MRRKAKIDDNQNEIVDALRKAGCSVTPTGGVGKGFPDIIVGRNDLNYLLEIKDGNKPPSAQKLTADQVKWHKRWKGQAKVVTSVTEAFKAVGLIKIEDA